MNQEQTARYEKNKKFADTVYLILRWVSGILLLVISLAGITESPVNFVLGVILSALLIPPIAKMLWEKSNVNIPTWSKILLGVVLFSAMVALDPYKKQHEQTHTPEASTVQQNSATFAESEVTEESVNSDLEDARERIAINIDTNNKLGVSRSDLEVIDNPKGDGYIVYVPETRFSGIERYLIWVVVDDKAYKTNSPSNMVTPDLPWSTGNRDPNINDPEWQKTGLSSNPVSELKSLIF